MQDPFLCDHERLRGLASEAVVRQGLACFKEQRIIELTVEPATPPDTGPRVIAHAQSTDGDRTYHVEVELDPTSEGDLLVDCDCGFADEPVCAHIIGTLLAYAARQPVSAAAERNAAEVAIAERAQRGRTEVDVRPLDGRGWPSTWAARSVATGRQTATEYRVEIRSVTERLNLCTCPDFAVNRLGTCKHIEAVLHRLSDRGPGRRKGRHIEPDRALVHVDWSAAGQPEIRLRRVAGASEALNRLLAAHFDPSGTLRGPLPDAFHRFAAQAAQAAQAAGSEGRDDIHIGADATQLAIRLGQDAAHRVRAEGIRREIEHSGGRLPGVNARLYPYQVQGAAFLAASGRALLADDMGLGKTLQAIAAAAWLMQHDGLSRVLIVCPASLKRQWAREIERFTAYEAVVVDGNTRARLASYRRRAPFTIVNYEIVTRDLSTLNTELSADLLILDEAQRIKNWRTTTAARIKGLLTDRAFVLTGTPLENRLEDLYSVMQVIDQRVLGPLWQFMLHFHVPDERGKVLGYRNLTELRRRLATVMLRRDRRLVRDQLPDRTELRLDVPLTPKQQEMQDGALQAASTLAQIMKRRPLTPVEEKRLLAALQMARMACDAAGLVDHETEGAPKLDELARLLEELCVDGGRKVVVFSQWTRMTEMAEAVAKGLGLGCVRLHGGVPTKARGDLIAKFQDDPATQVFLSTDAGGVGLNLQCASALINLDLPWNPAVLDQRLARVHRLGQRESVQLVLLVSSPSYEERVGAILVGKRHLFTHVIGEDATEDVVGLSKRTMELALEALEPSPPASAELTEDASPEAPPAVEAPGEAAPPPSASPTSAPISTPSSAWAPEMARAIEALQVALGTRLERLLVASAGLLALVDRVDDALRSEATAAADPISVTVLDTATWHALRRFAGETAFAGAQEAYARPDEVPAPADPLLALAHRKLDAAGVLRERGCVADALECLTAAVLAELARRAGERVAPPAAEAAAWLFGSAVPGGQVAVEDAHLALRLQALSLARSVPEALVEAAFGDVSRLIPTLPT